jgi:phosphoribosyl 1,2-cyclic phosphodiesterase
LTHPGGATAYRFDYGGRSACYISDVEHSPDRPEPALVAFCANADLVIYDTMFTDTEFWGCRGWGHSTWGAGVALCVAAKAKALAATHHHMRHTDMNLDVVDEQLRIALPGSFVAREGQDVRLTRRSG